MSPMCCLFFFFNDTATTEIYTLSLHDALPISRQEWRDGTGTEASQHDVHGDGEGALPVDARAQAARTDGRERAAQDRKSTRLNSSHANISYAVFCLKKKNTRLTNE